MRRVRTVAQARRSPAPRALRAAPTSRPGCDCSRSGRRRRRTAGRESAARRDRAAPERLSCRPTQNGPWTVNVTSCGRPPPFWVAGSKAYAKVCRMSAIVRASAVARHRPLLHEVEAPDIVDAEDVVGVAVGEDDRVDASNAVGQRLLAQIGSGIHQHRRAIVELHEDRRPQAAVARVGRLARAAVAADHRHAARRSGSEKSDRQGSMIRLSSCCAWT